MNIHKINDVFSPDELARIREIIDAAVMSNVDNELGRLQVYFDLPNELRDRVAQIAKDLGYDGLELSSASHVEYNNLYGNPNLPPHFDGDTIDLIIDFQLDGNTSWDIGLNCEAYPLEDNSALVFNPNENIHWRPIKDFKDGEYLRMIFFRLCNLNQRSDYSHMRYTQGDPIFDEVKAFRNSLYNSDII